MVAAEGYKIQSNLRVPEFIKNLQQTVDRIARRSYLNHAK